MFLSGNKTATPPPSPPIPDTQQVTNPMMACCSSATKQWTDWCVAYCLRLARISCDDAAGSGVPASAHIWSHKSRTRSASCSSIGLMWVMLVSSPCASFCLIVTLPVPFLCRLGRRARNKRGKRGLLHTVPQTAFLALRQGGRRPPAPPAEELRLIFDRRQQL